MDPHRDANAPPPYVDPVVPYTAPTLTEKSGAPPPGWANPDAPQGSMYPQLNPGYPPQGPPQGYPPQGPPQGYPPQGPPQGYPPQGPPQGYPPQGPPQGYPPQGPPSAQQINVQVTAPYVIQTMSLGPYPVHVDCPTCGKSIKTMIERNSNTRTHLFALVLCLLGCWPCVCVPYCMSSCTDTSHKCPQCKHFFGIYRNT